jgi:hypothetical protein
MKATLDDSRFKDKVNSHIYAKVQLLVDQGKSWYFRTSRVLYYKNVMAIVVAASK